jgi:serine phosphatase RsbU (regulator of sigma subunit)
MIAGFAAHWERTELKLSEGERILIMTDGLVETRDKNNEEYGHKPLIKTLETGQPGMDSETLVGNLLTNARGKSVTWDADDVTLVSLTRRVGL